MGPDHRSAFGACRPDMASPGSLLLLRGRFFNPSKRLTLPNSDQDPNVNPRRRGLHRSLEFLHNASLVYMDSESLESESATFWREAVGSVA